MSQIGRETQRNVSATQSNQQIVTTPVSIRKSRRELLPAEIPPNKNEYLQKVFPTDNTRPPILHYHERDPNGYPNLYDPDPNDQAVIASGQHWVLFRRRSSLPIKYHEHVVKWLAYIIGTVVHHVAISKWHIYNGTPFKFTNH